MQIISILLQVCSIFIEKNNGKIVVQVGFVFDRNTAVLTVNDVELVGISSWLASVVSLSMGVLGFFRVLMPMIEEHVLRRAYRRMRRKVPSLQSGDELFKMHE